MADLLGQIDPIEPQGVEQQADGVCPSRVLERCELLVTWVVPQHPGGLGDQRFPFLGAPQVIVSWLNALLWNRGRLALTAR
ncbi:MAG: hypothetical protein M3Z25_11630 [Actinomycetota bacterium]|nr:hypothetical protein [Actinomycetota bacterium]